MRRKMLRALALGLLVSYLIILVSGDSEFVGCSCDEEGLWSVQTILECQKVSDFLIAVAYFSIPLELLYFISFSNVPFKWVLVQFIAFIVLCGLTHLLNGWTYYGPHSFQLMLWLTIFKFLTALVSCATAITLLTLIPLLLKWKVRELYLQQNVLELNQEVGMMKKQKEASMHVRMLTREIRKSLDKHTILYTTLVELSKILDLQNCAVWMPNESRSEMRLTHELRANSLRRFRLVPIDDSDVLEIRETKGVKILRPESRLAKASCDGSEEFGAVAAIRMPMLHGSNFKGGTPEFVDTSYGILVLVLPNLDSRAWSTQEMEIVEVVADQVAVALSHASVLEESQLMREKLSIQNRALQRAKQSAMMASQARNTCQKVMSHGMRRPMHTILGLLSMFQIENMGVDQKIIVDTLVKTGAVLSTLINDVIDISPNDGGKSPLEVKRFQLHSMIREASCVAKCLCVYKGYGFEIDVQSSLPGLVVGDEKRTFQLILYMVGHVLDMYDGGKTAILRVFADSRGSSQDKNIRELGMWKPHFADDCIGIRFEIEISDRNPPSDALISVRHPSNTKYSSNGVKEGLSFGMCRKLAQMMQGNIWISPNSLGKLQSMTLALRFQLNLSFARGVVRASPGNSLEKRRDSYSRLRGLRVILADDDDVNRSVTKKLLEKLGCEVTAVSSGFECLSVLTKIEMASGVVLIDLHMPEMDGFEVAMRIRKFCGHSWPLIIGMTASKEEHVRERCLQMGMNGLIQKPVLLRMMAEELKRVLQQSGE